MIDGLPMPHNMLFKYFKTIIVTETGTCYQSQNNKKGLVWFPAQGQDHTRGPKMNLKGHKKYVKFSSPNFALIFPGFQKSSK